MQPSKISVQQLQELLSNLPDGSQVVDVRSAGEFAQVRIDDPRVVNIDLNQILQSTDQLTGESIYLICNSGSRSSIAQILLKNKGIQTINVEGGVSAWISSGFPVTSD